MSEPTIEMYRKALIEMCAAYENQRAYADEDTDVLYYDRNERALQDARDMMMHDRALAVKPKEIV